MTNILDRFHGTRIMLIVAMTLGVLFSGGAVLADDPVTEVPTEEATLPPTEEVFPTGEATEVVPTDVPGTEEATNEPLIVPASGSLDSTTEDVTPTPTLTAEEGTNQAAATIIRLIIGIIMGILASYN